MVINHRFSKLTFALTVLIFSAVANAAEYSSLVTCRSDFYKANPAIANGDPDQAMASADAFCKPKMVLSVFCDEQARFNPLLSAAEAASSKATCNATGGTSVAVAPASTGSTFNVPPNSFGIPLPPDPSASIAACGTNQTCVQMRQAESAALLNTYNQRVAAAKASQPQPQAQQNQPQASGGSGAGNIVQAALPVLLNGIGGGEQEQQQQRVQAQPAQQTQLTPANTDTPIGGNVARSVSEAVQAVPAQLSPAAQNAALAQAQAAPAAADPAVAAFNGTPLAPAANTVGEGIKKPDIGPAAPTPEISMASEALSGTFKQQMEQMTQRATTFFNQVEYTKTAAVFGKMQQLVTDFEEAKEKCKDHSERTEKLCVEQSSPGAQAVRALMDVAGPMMAAMNAQKTCSASSKVMNLAGLGLTAANGVCIASKMKCDGLCKAATAKLNESKEKFKTEYDTAFAADTQALTLCETTPPPTALSPPTPRQVDCTKKKTAATKEGTRPKDTTVTLLDKQVDPATQGTPNAMLAKCDNKIRNIIGMMTNIAALAMAKKGSDDCEKKLSTSGQAGNALSTQQYCEIPANTASQFCKCQNGSTAEGCPSAQMIAGAGEGGSGENPNDAAGSSIRPNSGLSNFAGAGMNGLKGGADVSLGGGAGGAEGDTSSPFGPMSSGAAALNAAGGGAGGGIGAGIGGNPTAAEEAKKKALEDDKKFSFGALAAGVSSMFGGGKGGSGNGDLKNVTPAMEANIQRKIASDRVGREVTPASGVSNWDKIHKTIIRVEGTLIRGN